MVPHSSILMFYRFSGDLITSYWYVIDSHVTSFQHTAILLILRWPHSSTLSIIILMGPFTMPAHWSIIDSHGTFYHASTLKYYWFSWDLILAHWSIIDSHGTLYHASTLKYYWFSGDLILAHWSIIILMGPFTMPAHWSIIDSQVPLFLHSVLHCWL